MLISDVDLGIIGASWRLLREAVGLDENEEDNLGFNWAIIHYNQFPKLLKLLKGLRASRMFDL
jgi:hypothetical protein